MTSVVGLCDRLTYAFFHTYGILDILFYNRVFTEFIENMNNIDFGYIRKREVDGLSFLNFTVWRLDNSNAKSSAISFVAATDKVLKNVV